MSIQKTAAEIAEIVKGELCGDCQIPLTGVSSLDEALAGDVSFYGNDKYRDLLLSTKASLVLVPQDFPEPPPAGRAWLRCASPSSSFTEVIRIFSPAPVAYPAGIHPTAVIDATANIASTAHIGPGAVISAGASVGEGSVIQANCFLGEHASIGENCLLYPNVVIRERCLLGNRVILHPGVVIGSDGFGYESSPAGHKKIPQVGIVVVEDDVEIGSNTTVDRARFGRTVIGAGTKIDNLVQIGHNVHIGHHCMIVSQVGVSGSSHLGNFVTLAGQAGLAGHLKIGDGAIVMGQAGVTKDLAPKSIVFGTPAIDRLQFARREALIKKIATLDAELKEIKKALNK